MCFSVPARAGEFGLVRQIRPSRPAPTCLFSTLRLNLVFTHEIPPAFGGGVHLFYRQPQSGQSRVLSGHAIVYQWRLLPRVRRRRARSPQGSFINGCYLFRYRYGYSTWTLHQEHYAKLRTVHHRVLLRIIGAQRKGPDHRMTLFNRTLVITRCESIDTTLRTRRLLWAGVLIRMSGGRLPKRIVFGNLEGAVRRRRGGKEKEWTYCVQSDIRAFGMTGE